MPQRHLQIIEHPRGVIRVRPPDLHVNIAEGTTTVCFTNHVGKPVTVVLNPGVNPNPREFEIAPGARGCSDLRPGSTGVFDYQIYLVPYQVYQTQEKNELPKAKGLCDPVIIVYIHN